MFVESILLIDPPPPSLLSANEYYRYLLFDSKIHRQDWEKVVKSQKVLLSVNFFLDIDKINPKSWQMQLSTLFLKIDKIENAFLRFIPLFKKDYRQQLAF